MTSKDVESAILKRPEFDPRRVFVVPNTYLVSKSTYRYEADLLVLSQAAYGTEIEIKVSNWDLKRDVNKAHKHDCPKIKYLYFAGPSNMQNMFETHAPIHAGIILVDERGARIHRKPVASREAHKWTAQERITLFKNCYHRYWNLRENVKGGVGALHTV